jgi:YVTN family beta-propeller protein
VCLPQRHIPSGPGPERASLFNISHHLLSSPKREAKLRNAIRLFAPNKSVPHHAGLLHNLSIVFFLLLPMGVGLGTATAQAQTRAYVTTSGSLGNTDFVSVIDTASNVVVASIPVGFSPFQIAITPDGTRAYVANQGSTNIVSVIDIATNTVAATIPGGFSPVGVAITTDGTRAYVTNDFSNTVSVIDTATNTVAATIPVGVSPIGVAIMPDGNNDNNHKDKDDKDKNKNKDKNNNNTRAYVANLGSNSVSVIDTAINTVVATVPVGAPFDIAITSDGTRAYVTNIFSNTVSVIETATNTVVATIPVGVNPIGVAITPDGNNDNSHKDEDKDKDNNNIRAYVTNEGSNSVSVIDTATNTVIATVPVGLAPFGVAITPDGTQAYVANKNSNTVSVIDTATNTVVATTPVGPLPLWVAITPAPQAPMSREQCEHGGYLKFGPPAGPFKNQGQCVRYVEHH